MNQEPSGSAIAHRWYARPVFFVTDLGRALDFYLGRLGFEKQWHEGDGAGTVCQVHRSDCEIILCETAERRDHGRLYIELTREGFDHLIREAVERSVATEPSWWGSDVVRIVDPDGNELLVPIPA